jgi:hypothetical protein
MNGTLVYRPTNWLTTTLEMIVEREIAVQEKGNHSSEWRDAIRAEGPSLLVDQAFVTSGLHRPLRVS